MVLLIVIYYERISFDVCFLALCGGDRRRWRLFLENGSLERHDRGKESDISVAFDDII